MVSRPSTRPGSTTSTCAGPLRVGLRMAQLATLGEGNTPLVPSIAIGPKLGLENLYFKLENCNPTGSYKDRFVALRSRSFLHAE